MKRFAIPKKLLEPVRLALEKKQRQLVERKNALKKEDPFIDPDRLNDNAAIDADAAEQFGHENVTAVTREIDKMLVRVKKALTRIKIGKYGLCEGCGNMIDTDRLAVNPTAVYCMTCEKKRQASV